MTIKVISLIYFNKVKKTNWIKRFILFFLIHLARLKNKKRDKTLEKKLFIIFILWKTTTTTTTSDDFTAEMHRQTKAKWAIKDAQIFLMVVQKKKNKEEKKII